MPWSMKRQLTLIGIFFGLLVSLNAQDPVFSQYYAAPLQMNPAFAGNTFAPRIALNYRNQWPGLGSPYVTYAASYEQLFEPLNSGIGISVLSDDAGNGIYQNTNFGLSYSYRLNISNDFFAKFGTEIGGTQTNLNWDKLIFADQIDRVSGATSSGGVPTLSNEERPDDLSKIYLDLGAGFLFYSPKFYAGISAKHLNTPNESFINFNENLENGLPIRWSLHGGLQIQVQEGNRLQWPVFVAPSVNLVKQGDFGQVAIGSYVGFGMFFAGAWYRHAFSNPDAAIISAGAQMGIYKLGYSIDLTVSDLAMEGTGGSHEVSFIINFENSESLKRKRRTSQHNDCFRLFR